MFLDNAPVRAILERACRQQGVPGSGRRLFRGFAHLQAVDLVWQDGSRQRRAAEMSPFQTEVMTALGWPLPQHYASLTPLLR